MEYFPGFTSLQLCYKVQEFLSKLSVEPEDSQDGLSSCRCSTTSHGDLKKISKNANQALNSFRFMRKNFQQEDGHSSDLDQKTVCSEAMVKRVQQDSGEERVTAKSKPMMNLVSRCSEKNPDVLASTASESPGKTRYESQLL